MVLKSQLKLKPNYFSYAYFLVLDYITPDCDLLDTIYASIPAMPFNRDCFSYLMPFPCFTNHTVSESIYRVHPVDGNSRNLFQKCKITFFP